MIKKNFRSWGLFIIALENKYMKLNIAIISVLAVLCACNAKPKETSANDSKATELFQGIWLDDDSETVLFRVEGDTIYYADNQNASVCYKIVGDSLYMYGSEVSRYKIDKQAEHIFWFHSLSGDVVKLHKSENADDSLAFSNKEVQITPIYREVTARDSVIIYNGKRYRAYVYINPSKMKVYKTSYSEEGISVDNVYYDNVIHICVYEGKHSLYASDITKRMFEYIIPPDFLDKAILADMHFGSIDSSGYHYQASLCIPESSLCYVVNLSISFDGKLSMAVLK